MFRSTLRNFYYARPLINNTHKISPQPPQSPQSPRFSTASTFRSLALTPPDHLDSKELYIFNKLVTELSPSRLEVQDVSGGCGSMYAIEIASRSFKGLPVVKQHRLVQEVLREEIKGWHGVQLRTKIE